jgi:hypothetical protein
VTVLDANNPQGAFPGSTDAPECRTFHLTASGRIDALPPAGGCEHGSVTTVDGDLMIQLDPYLDAPPQCQVTTGSYCVLIRNLDGTMALVANGGICFTVRQPAKEGC